MGQVERDRASHSVSLLISMLVRYPEISSINFNPKTHSLKLTFLMTSLISEKRFDSWRWRLMESLEALAHFQGRPVGMFELHLRNYGDVSVLEVVRDVSFLTPEEISLLITLLKEEFQQLVVSDRNDSFVEEDLLIQEEIIEEMLEDLKDTKQERNIIAFREEGRVLVFNK